MSRKKQPKQKKPTSNPSNMPLDWNRAIQEAKSSVKHLDKKIKTVSKGIQYDWLNNTSFNNVVYPRDKIPDRLLRLVERRNGIVASIITLGIQQALEFSHISHDKDIPGWEFILKDDKKTPSSTQKKQKEFLENFLKNTFVSNYNGYQVPNDTIKDLLIKYVRDRTLIDKVVWEIERNKKGEAVALWVLDGATILPVLPGGFYGSASQVGIGAAYNKLSEEIRRAKLDEVPPLDEIAYIQELIYGVSGGGVAATFRESDLIYDLGNELNEIQCYKQGLSVVEKANTAIVAFINSLTFNSNGLSRGAVPKIALAMGKESGYTQEQLEDAQDEWAANFEAMDGQWNIPLLNGDAKVLNLLPNNRDMEYQKYMEFTAALTCSICGVDSAELGLRLNQAQNVMSENTDGKQIFSKNRGVRERLGGFAYIVNRFLKISGYDFADDFMFKFNGLSTEDKSFEADLRKKAVETDTSINELRAEKDLPPDPYGDIILNPQYIQYRMQKEQAAEMAAQESEEFVDEEEDDTDNMVNEVMDEMEKAVRLI